MLHRLIEKLSNDGAREIEQNALIALARGEDNDLVLEIRIVSS